jgi:hypothetical protein
LDHGQARPRPVGVQVRLALPVRAASPQCWGRTAVANWKRIAQNRLASDLSDDSENSRKFPGGRFPDSLRQRPGHPTFATLFATAPATYSLTPQSRATKCHKPMWSLIQMPQLVWMRDGIWWFLITGVSKATTTRDGDDRDSTPGRG